MDNRTRGEEEEEKKIKKKKKRTTLSGGGSLVPKDYEVPSPQTQLCDIPRLLKAVLGNALHEGNDRTVEESIPSL